MKSKLLSLILMLIAVLIVSVQPICLAQEEVVEEEEEAWGGADGEAGDMITVINPDYEPWFESIWEPPSGEIESMLFRKHQISILA